MIHHQKNKKPRRVLLIKPIECFGTKKLSSTRKQYDTRCAAIQEHVKIRENTQGWTDSQALTSLILLNLVGGTSVDDLKILNTDPGFCEVLRRTEFYGLKRKERREQERRWRKEKKRFSPSPSAMFRYLSGFHYADLEKARFTASMNPMGCTSKGKAHKRYKFGCKVSVVVTSRGGWFLRAYAIYGNPYDSHTLSKTLKQVERISQKPEPGSKI